MHTDRSIAPVFVVGTGRCGSTMLSDMLRAHPDILSLSEFMVAIADFGGRTSRAFPGTPIDARELWRFSAVAIPGRRSWSATAAKWRR